jgi:uncharacterized membrane protein YfcA
MSSLVFGSITLGSLTIIAVTIVGTSFISGIFGMAGGMILLGVLLLFFDVVTGMVLFSVIQLAANGWRAVLWWRFVRWPIFWLYVIGAFLAFLAMRAVAFVPDKAMVYLALGVMPFLIEILPATARPNIEWRGVPFITGVLTTLVQLIAGVGGQFLDIFFQKSLLDRKTTVATKAVTQTFAHLLRLIYFGSLAGAMDIVPIWVHAPAILLAIVGTSLAPYVLERLTDVGFRQWTRWIILAISVIYLGRGLWLVWQP